MSNLFSYGFKSVGQIHSFLADVLIAERTASLMPTSPDVSLPEFLLQFVHQLQKLHERQMRFACFEVQLLSMEFAHSIIS